MIHENILGTIGNTPVVRINRPKGSAILAMLPDTGERYFTTVLFEGINEGSDEEPAA
jgi:cysteine synthase A